MLQPSEIAKVARDAGFSGFDLVRAVAIALAESGGHERAYNPETAAHTPDGCGSFGLWQIYLNEHPEFASGDLLDPAENAKAAFTVYWNSGRSFKAWSTFNNRSYVQHIHDATEAVEIMNLNERKTP